jgi:demethoxyubiquinone hydroxylase (CLK1/Coq7/Cat5 family)
MIAMGGGVSRLDDKTRYYLTENLETTTKNHYRQRLIEMIT